VTCVLEELVAPIITVMEENYPEDGRKNRNVLNFGTGKKEHMYIYIYIYRV